MVIDRASHRVFLGVSALLFAASGALTTVWCASMSAMRGMPMPGGWTMSMTWMHLPGQTWYEAAVRVRTIPSNNISSSRAILLRQDAKRIAKIDKMGDYRAATDYFWFCY